MDEKSFIGQLREIRSNLLDAVHSNHQLEMKLVGPSGEGQSGNEKVPPETVNYLLTEIGNLSVQLVKFAARHHDILGEFAPNAPIRTGAARAC